MMTPCEDHRQENPTLEGSLLRTYNVSFPWQTSGRHCALKRVGVPLKPISIVDRLPSRAKYVSPAHLTSTNSSVACGKVALHLPRSSSPRRSATERHLWAAVRPPIFSGNIFRIGPFLLLLVGRLAVISILASFPLLCLAASDSRSSQVLLWEPGEPLWRCSSSKKRARTDRAKRSC